ncbi:MAG TPA: HAMP domain-containing sensor histidine kinase, partial [Gemmatimonadaceae bacterium]|nr:HAMP domain-containing sensor histidine kinase [Gemmatimonadaceae bacterium]
LILVLDALTPAGVVVGILVGVPIVLASASDDERHLWILIGFASVGFVLAAALGVGPMSAPAVWLPNRILAFLTIPFMGAVALRLQRRRVEMARARDAALAAGRLNRLLMSLLAHDLRAPLTLAADGFSYVEGALARGQPVDPALLADVRARLRRNLRAIEAVLSVARQDAEGRGTPVPPSAPLREEIADELAAFADEAREHGKRFVADLDALGDARPRVDTLVLRQALAILLDNAVRHAAPGPIRVTASLASAELHIVVTDAGPAPHLPAAIPPEPHGSGLGLQLCHALVAHAGGTLTMEREASGTRCELRLRVG